MKEKYQNPYTQAIAIPFEQVWLAEICSKWDPILYKLDTSILSIGDAQKKGENLYRNIKTNL